MKHNFQTNACNNKVESWTEEFANQENGRNSSNEANDSEVGDLLKGYKRAEFKGWSDSKISDDCGYILKIQNRLPAYEDFSQQEHFPLYKGSYKCDIKLLDECGLSL